MTEDQQKRIDKFIYNVNLDGSKEMLKTLGVEDEQLETGMSLGRTMTVFIHEDNCNQIYFVAEMLNQVERLNNDKLGSKTDFYMRKKFFLIDDDMKV